MNTSCGYLHICAVFFLFIINVKCGSGAKDSDIRTVTKLRFLIFENQTNFKWFKLEVMQLKTRCVGETQALGRFKVTRKSILMSFESV